MGMRKQPSTDVTLNGKKRPRSKASRSTSSLTQVPMQMCCPGRCSGSYLRPTETTLIAFGGARVPADGVLTLECKTNKHKAVLDFHVTNVAVKRQHYSIPTPEDVRSRLAGKSIFSILDEKDGYWQIKLDEPSSKFCTFNTPWGWFRFLRLPFWIKSASEVFQLKNCETFGDIPGVYITADDMIIAASSEQDHDEILQKVMERAKTANVKFNKDKIQFKVDTVKYMGHIITAAG